MHTTARTCGTEAGPQKVEEGKEGAACDTAAGLRGDADTERRYEVPGTVQMREGTLGEGDRGVQGQPGGQAELGALGTAPCSQPRMLGARGPVRRLSWRPPVS